MLTLPLNKEGTTPGKLTLSLKKGSKFTIALAWNSKKDLDVHALLATNSGNGAKVSAFEQVLSTFNAKRTNPQGILVTNPDGSFSTPCGSLRHSGDSRDGTMKDIDETIIVDGSKIPAGVNEVPIFVTIHPAGQVTFAEVESASITILDEDGKELGAFKLTTEFSKFNAVQMGSLMLGEKGWEFSIVGSGFIGDFNTVLEHFS